MRSDGAFHDFASSLDWAIGHHSGAFRDQLPDCCDTNASKLFVSNVYSADEGGAGLDAQGGSHIRFDPSDTGRMRP